MQFVGEETVGIWGRLMMRPFVFLLLAAVACGETATPRPTSVPEDAAVLAAGEDATCDPQVGASLQAMAVPFDTTEPGGDFTDLMPLKEIIGDARIVSLGEATHGTREFFRMKHRMLEFLVKEMGFTVLAFEDHWAMANPVNEYVHTGEGDAAELLNDFLYWIWKTQEVLDMIEWMRSYNSAPTSASAVSFHGFDYVGPIPTLADVVRYVEEVDPGAVPTIKTQIAYLLARQTSFRDYMRATDEVRTSFRNGLQAVHDHLLAHQSVYEAASSPKAFADAVQGVRVAQQWEAHYGGAGGPVGASPRDRFMAENVGWILDQAGPTARIVLWAHNSHVQTVDWVVRGFTSEAMGTFLREMYSDEMVVVGFSLYDGSFNAETWDSSTTSNIRSGIAERHRVVPLAPNSSEACFHATGLPRFFLDLRNQASDSPGGRWLQEPHWMRSIGLLYSENSDPTEWATFVTLPEAYDVIVHIEDTTPSILLR